MDESLLFEQWLSDLSTFEEPNFWTTSIIDAQNQEFINSHQHQQQQNSQVSNIKRSAEQFDPYVITSGRPQTKKQNTSFFVSPRKNQEEITRPKEEILWSSSSSPTLLVFDSSSLENKNHSTLKKPRIIGSNIRVDSEGINRPISQSKEHILAERKRREKINERLISLSRLVPGLSKMDKATILASAVEYIKQLEEKVKSLEDETKRIKTMEPRLFHVKTYDDNACNKPNSLDETSSDGSVISIDQSFLPEIEARVCNKDVLISIHSLKKKGAIERVVAEIEKLNLTAVNSSSMSFGDSGLSISIVAQMDEEFNMNISQVVKSLHGALDNLYY